MSVLNLIIDELLKTGSIFYEDYDHMADENHVRSQILKLKKRNWQFKQIKKVNHEGLPVVEGFAVVKVGDLA